MNDYLEITIQNKKKRKLFFKKLRQYIYEESSKRLWDGSCAITMKAIIQRLNEDKDLDININLNWPSGKYKNNINKHIQFLDRLSTRKDSGVIKILPAGKLSIHKEAQRVANGGNLVIALNANYRYSDRTTGRDGWHHVAIVVDNLKITDNPKIGQGGVPYEEYIFTRISWGMNWGKENDQGIDNKDTTMYFWLKGD